jgi:hypothetical protein
MSSAYKDHYINGSKKLGFSAMKTSAELPYKDRFETLVAVKKFIDSKTHDKCEAVVQNKK